LLYCGLLSGKNPNLAVIEQILSQQLAVKTELWPLQGQWLEIHSRDLSLLGKNNSRLGKSAINGTRVFDRLNKIRLRLSQLELTQYLAFLPRGPAYEELRSLIAILVPREMTVEVELKLQAGQAKPGRLKAATRLGFNSWLLKSPCQRQGVVQQHKSYLLQGR